MKDRHRPGYLKEYYSKLENKIRQKEYMVERKKNWEGFINNFKKDKSCNYCGWKNHPEILQFHHKDPKKKGIGVSHTMSRSNQVMIEEIKKCDLLCPNCHFLLHYKKGKKLNKED